MREFLHPPNKRDMWILVFFLHFVLIKKQLIGRLHLKQSDQDTCVHLWREQTLYQWDRTENT